MKKIKKYIDKLFTSKIFLVILLFIGLSIFIYPIISDKYYSLKQESTVKEYENMLENLPTQEGKEIIEEAIEYNKLLSSTDPGIFSSSRSQIIAKMIEEGKLPVFFSYGRLIGTVDIPKINIKLPIRSGTDEDILEQNAGFMMNTSLPVGGESTHSVITAHRGLPSSRLFTDLNQLEIGDVFYIQVLDKPHAYEIDQIKVIDPTDVKDLKIIDGEDYTTLLTCHPYMINSQRLIVRGHRIPYTQELRRVTDKVKSENILKMLIIKYKEYIIGISIFIILLILNNLKIKHLKKRYGNGDYEGTSKNPD